MVSQSALSGGEKEIIRMKRARLKLFISKGERVGTALQSKAGLFLRR